MSASQKRCMRKLGLQPLENRELMAGDVAGIMAGTTLELTGDAKDNQIEVVQVAANTIEVIGHGGTTVNGNASDLFVFSALENIQAEMNDGDDQVAFENLSLPGSLDVSTGRGHDDVKVHRGRANLATVNTGEDNDVVRFHSVNIDDRTSIETENGADKVNVYQLRTGELDVMTGYDNDKVDLERVGAGGMIQVGTDEGHDVVNMTNVRAQGILVDNGIGNDRDTMRRVRAGQIDVYTGSDLDNLDMKQVRANDININSLDGDDDISLSWVAANNHLRIDSGLQADNVSLNKVSACNLEVLTGSADDSVKMQNIRAKDIVVDTLHGDDTVAASNVNVGNSFTTRTGEGDDVVEFDNIRADFASGHVGIQLGQGNDSLRINRLFGNDIHIETCDGEDKVDASWVIAVDELFVELGDDDDSLALEHSWNGGLRVIDGGNGFDTLVDQPNFFDEVGASVNFENIV